MIKTFLMWIAAYLVGSIPFGLLWAWLLRGIDVRKKGSGRTGGTNVWRTAGCLPAFFTAVFDGLKGASAVWLAEAMDLSLWAVAIAGTLTVVGHNYSVFLRFRGGAGTGTSVGVATGLWEVGLPVLAFSMVAMALLVGHASVGSIFVALLLPTIFLVRGQVPYALGFGVPTMLLTLWALRPNIQRLLKREERFLPLFVDKPPLIQVSRHPAAMHGSIHEGKENR